MGLYAFLAPTDRPSASESRLRSARLGKNLGIRNRIPFFSSALAAAAALTALTPSGEVAIVCANMTAAAQTKRSRLLLLSPFFLRSQRRLGLLRREKPRKCDSTLAKSFLPKIWRRRKESG